jgi:hypothetical protein
VKAAAVLAADKKAKLKELLGKPFTGELRPRFPGEGGFGTGSFLGGGPLAGVAPPD